MLFGTLKSNQFVRGLFYLLFGIGLLLKPEPLFHIVVYLIAAYFAIMAVIHFVNAARNRETPFFQSELVSGIFSLITMAIILVFAKVIISIIPFFLGLFVLLNGIRQLMQELQLRHSGVISKGWIIFSCLMILAGGFLVFSPFRSVLALLQLFGGIMIALGISELLGLFQERY